MNTTLGNKKDLKNAFVAERALNEAVERLDRNTQGKIAVHVHLSRLQSHRRREEYVRIACDTFTAQIVQLGGQTFNLHNLDVVALCPASDLLSIEGALARLRNLFQEDPLTQFTGEHAPSSFATWYRIDKDYDSFASVVRGIFRAAEQARSLLMQQEEMQSHATNLRDLEPAVLGKLEHAIARADLSNVIRNQTACVAAAGQPLSPVFREYFVDIAQLQSYVTPGVELRTNRWLFQYLTATLDKRMLAYVTREDLARGDVPFSMNMNVSSVLTPEFKRFDNTVPKLVRGHLVIEMQLIDIFADLGAYFFARDYLQDHGYRVCLDGINHMTLRTLERTRLGADLLKMYWAPDGLNTIDQAGLQQFKDMVAQFDQARTILCRCEDEFALEFGRNVGIMMFQGYYIEKQLTRQRQQALLGQPVDPLLPAPGAPPQQARR